VSSAGAGDAQLWNRSAEWRFFQENIAGQLCWRFRLCDEWFAVRCASAKCQAAEAAAGSLWFSARLIDSHGVGGGSGSGSSFSLLESDNGCCANGLVGAFSPNSRKRFARFHDRCEQRLEFKAIYYNPGSKLTIYEFLLRYSSFFIKRLLKSSKILTI